MPIVLQVRSLLLGEIWYTNTYMELVVNSDSEMKDFGVRLGALLKGGEVIELVGDVGAGKTTLTKGIAAGMGVTDDVQSPTFTISRTYEANNGLRLAHYDFYRLIDAGIMSAELAEAVRDERTVTILEWAEIVTGVLPSDVLRVRIASPAEDARLLELSAHGDRSSAALGAL